MAYEIIQTAQECGDTSIAGPGGKYDMARILAAMPVSPASVPADVFLSYSHKDGGAVEALYDELKRRRFTVWYDEGLIAGQPYRNELRRRIETAKAVVVLWTANSVTSEWVSEEAALAAKHNKLVCLREPGLDSSKVPLPFGARHMAELNDTPALLKALAALGANPGT